jgi:glycosyltransferase involved in cell wall biosynthesis
MRVLFVCSGNSKNFSMAPFIRSQGESLKAIGINLLYFRIHRKGFIGYLKTAFDLRKYIRKNSFDILHAHYCLSGWVTLLAFPKQPIVLSLMGSDAFGKYIDVNKVSITSKYLKCLTYLIQPFVSSIICKSRKIQKSVILKRKSHILPNGITFNKILCDRTKMRRELGLEPLKKYILFLGNKKDKGKNYKLAEASVDMINRRDVMLLSPYPVPHEQVFKYLMSVDLLLLTSSMEGSPNVVKEAMSCNCPVVATDVGDIAWLFGNTPGYYLSNFDPQDVEKKIREALNFSEKFERTKGRKRIEKLGLRSEDVAMKLNKMYKELLN